MKAGGSIYNLQQVTSFSHIGYQLNSLGGGKRSGFSVNSSAVW